MNVFFAVMRCDVNSDWKRMLLAIILDYCEGSVSILVGKLKIVLYLYELTENLYGSAYSLYAGDAGSVVPLFASGVGVDVDTDLLHHDEEGAGVQAGGEVPQVQIRSGQASGCDSFFEHHRQHLGRRGVGRQATILFGSTWFGIISAMTTLLVLVFSEIVPKTIGTSYWKNLMGFVTSAISFLSVLMWPLVIMIRLITNLMTKDEDEATVSREEVTAMANIGAEEGVSDSDENKVIQNIMKLDNVKACDVMTPKIVAMTAQENMSLKNFYKNDTYLHFSRIPVYGDSPEYITGYILLSDALEGLADDEFDKRLVELKRPISFFTEEDSCGHIWEELLKKHEQIGLIIDEYGCFQGIITLEDIIETILGLEIIDENDQATDMQQLARERWERRQKRFRTIVLPKEDDKSQA